MERLTLEEAIKHAKEVAKTNRAEATYNFPNLKEYYDNCLECANQHNQLAEWLEELQKYKQIGTLEEVREAMERQRAKRPKNVKTEGYRYTDTYRCQTCGGNFSGTGIADYCYHCGQKLDWSEAEE